MVKIEVLSTIGDKFESPSHSLYFVVSSWLIWIKERLFRAGHLNSSQNYDGIEISFLIKLKFMVLKN